MGKSNRALEEGVLEVEVGVNKEEMKVLKEQRVEMNLEMKVM